VQQQIEEIDTQIRHQQAIQSTLQRSMDNAREAMQEMISLHRLSLEQQLPPSETQQTALATAQSRFLDAQDRFETSNAEIAQSNQTKFDLNEQLRSLNEQIQSQEEPAREEYRELYQRHKLKVASFKLAFIVPLFLVAAALVHRCRRSPYRPICMAALVASFWKVGTVMFEHFPRDYFKYIAIVAAIGIVVAFLIWVLRKVSRPETATVLKRFREAYAEHHCPVCAYPIARGLLRYARWTRKGPIPLGSGESGNSPEAEYACPSCGTHLFTTCEQCGSSRHCLLPYCDHCGAAKAVAALSNPSPSEKDARPASQGSA
jgi:predicted RNA-binding Zn-ribbon protein involved in translation (DUF1610 family)